MLSYEGAPKPRYHALRLLNALGNVRLNVEGEGSHVKAIASRKPGSISVVLVNYDIENQHSEVVPFGIEGLTPGNYTLIRERLSGVRNSASILINETGKYSELIQMEPNDIISLELQQ